MLSSRKSHVLIVLVKDVNFEANVCTEVDVSVNILVTFPARQG